MLLHDERFAVAIRHNQYNIILFRFDGIAARAGTACHWKLSECLWQSILVNIVSHLNTLGLKNRVLPNVGYNSDES